MTLNKLWKLKNYYSFYQTIKYVQNTSIGSLNSAIIGECKSELKKLGLGLTEGEIIQIANLAPQSDVELYLVREVLMVVLSCCA